MLAIEKVEKRKACKGENKCHLCFSLLNIIALNVLVHYHYIFFPLETMFRVIKAITSITLVINPCIPKTALK